MHAPKKNNVKIHYIEKIFNISLLIIDKLNRQKYNLGNISNEFMDTRIDLCHQQFLDLLFFKYPRDINKK